MNEIGLPSDGARRDASDNKAQIARIMLLGHDLRAAVSDILGGLHLLADEDLSPGMRLQFERMRAAGEDMARLIEEGFEIVTDQAVGPLRQTVQLARLLYDLEMRWTGRAQEKGLGFHVAMAPDVPVLVRLDRIALERVLSNMLSNAVKYTDQGAVRLALTVEAETRLLFSVLDDGPGFDPDLRGRLFRQGARGEVPGKAGNGLGLFISRDMARRLEGRIEVSNRAEGGACVALSLPLAGLMPPEMAIDTPLPDLSRMRVLVAEDSALNQAVLGHMLSAMGAHCDSAADGVEALEMLDNGSYDLAVIDAEMPRLSGLDLIRTLRASGGRHSAIPVVVCTAYVLRANREAIVAAGADAIVSKPMTAIEPLAEAITQALERHDGEGHRPCPP
ncbi:hybrid sensor histidine kinase/response regulator, partial [Rhodobacter capsulatus]